jgi:hypothetical protein
MIKPKRRNQPFPKQDDFFLVVGKPSGQKGCHPEFGELTGLDPERSEAKPAF